MTYTAKTMKALRLGRSAARKARVALATALVAAGLVAPALVAGVAASPAHASTIFIVNSTSHFADVNVGDGVCDTFSGSGGSCTLRAAIQQANATLGADVVDFDIGPAFRDPVSNVATISPNSPLPNIIDKVTIDGYTEPGAQENTLSQGTDAQIKVELSGANAGTANGLPDALLAPRTVR